MISVMVRGPATLKPRFMFRLRLHPNLQHLATSICVTEMQFSIGFTSFFGKVRPISGGGEAIEMYSFTNGFQGFPL